MNDDLPAGHDVFLVANLIHYWSPEDNVTLLRRVRRAAAPGARLLLADFWTDSSHTKPVHAALMAASSLSICGTATSTASTKSGTGCPRQGGASSSTSRWAAPRA